MVRGWGVVAIRIFIFIPLLFSLFLFPSILIFRLAYFYFNERPMWVIADIVIQLCAIRVSFLLRKKANTMRQNLRFWTPLTAAPLIPYFYK